MALAFFNANALTKSNKMVSMLNLMVGSIMLYDNQYFLILDM